MELISVVLEDNNRIDSNMMYVNNSLNYNRYQAASIIITSRTPNYEYSILLKYDFIP